MVLGKSIFAGGRVLLQAGVELQPSYLERLRELGVYTVCIREPGDEEIDPEDYQDMVSERTRHDAYMALHDVMEKIRNGFEAVNFSRVKDTVTRIIDEVLNNPGVMPQLVDIRAMDDHVFSHSVGVCAMATYLGYHIGWEPDDLRALSVGALLHDIGKVRIPDAVWNKPGGLTDEEYRMVQKHPEYGWEILRAHPEIDSRSAAVALQHQEHYDGSGYPKGLKGEQIHRFARVVTIADVFDALTSDRPYRLAFSYHDAIIMMKEEEGTMFDPQFLRTFLARVAPYPVGCEVKLNTGEVGVVVRLNKGLPARPVVRLLAPQGKVELNLAERMDKRIVGPVYSGGGKPDEN